MIANVSAHRRANAFAQALEDRTDQGTAAEQPAESAEPAEQGRLLALASGLGELPRPTLDPEVKVVQRAQLVAAMEAMLLEGTVGGGVSSGPTVPEQRTSAGVPTGPPRSGNCVPRSRWSKGLAAGGLTVGVAAGAFGGVAAASSDALPGDSLYGLKRGMEDIKLGMADDDSAPRRALPRPCLDPAERSPPADGTGPLRPSGPRIPGRDPARPGGMKHDATEGHRLLHQAYERDGSLGPIATLSSFSASHRQTWDGLRDRLPVQLHRRGRRGQRGIRRHRRRGRAAPGACCRALPEQGPGHAPGRGSTQDAGGNSQYDRPSPSAPSRSERHVRTTGSDSPHPSGPAPAARTRRPARRQHRRTARPAAGQPRAIAARQGDDGSPRPRRHHPAPAPGPAAGPGHRRGGRRTRRPSTARADRGSQPRRAESVPLTRTGRPPPPSPCPRTPSPRLVSRTRRPSEEDRPTLHQQLVERVLDLLTYLVRQVEHQHRILGRLRRDTRPSGSARRTGSSTSSAAAAPRADPATETSA